MSQEPLTTIDGPPRTSTYAALSFIVTGIAAAWFVVELCLASGWRDATVFHDAGVAVALVAMLLAALALGTHRGRRRTAWLAFGLTVVAFAFFLLIVPL